MAADLFESYEVTLVASIILGVAAFNSIGMNPALGLDVPARRPRHRRRRLDRRRLRRARPSAGETNALKPINRGFLVAGVAHAGRHAARRPLLRRQRQGQRRLEVLRRRRHRPRAGPGASAASPSTTPAPTTARCRRSPSRPRPARPRSCCPARRSASSRRSTPSSPSPSPSAWRSPSAAATCTFSLYLVALRGMGMLATTGVIVSEDTFGPVSATTPPASPRCRASSTASPSGSWSASTPSATPPRPSPRASPSARPSSPPSPCSPASSRPPAPSSASSRREPQGRRAAARPSSPINVAEPKIFIGLLIGGAVPFLFSALAIRAVGRTAGVVVQEVRSQFADGKIMSGDEAARLRPGHRHLHRGVAARARHAGAARRAHARRHRLRHRLAGARRASSPPSSSSAS